MQVWLVMRSDAEPTEDGWPVEEFATQEEAEAWIAGRDGFEVFEVSRPWTPEEIARRGDRFIEVMGKHRAQKTISYLDDVRWGDQ